MEQPELDLEARRCHFRILLLLYAAGVILSLCIQQGNGTLLLFAATSVQSRLEILGYSMRVFPELFVSFHGAAVLLLTLLGTWLKIWLRRHSADPSITTQLVWGFLAMTFAFVLLSALSPPVGPEFPMSAWGLVSSYVLLSLGEALLAPLGMALVTRFALPHKAALVTSLWFLASALGVGLAGWLGLLWNRLTIGLYFTLLALPPLAAGAAFLICTRSLEDALHESSNP